MSDQDVNNVLKNDFIERKSNKDGNFHDERSNFLVGRGRSKIENQNKSIHRNVSELHNTKNTKLFQANEDDAVLHHTLGGSVTHTAWSNIKRILTNPYLKVPHGYKLTKYQKEKEMGLQSSSSYTLSTENNDFNIPKEYCMGRWETESNGTQSYASTQGYSLYTPERSQENVDESQVQRVQMHQTEKRLKHVPDSRLTQVGSPTSAKKPVLIHENIVIIQTPKEIMRNIIGTSREISEDEETIWETGTQNTKTTRISDYDIHKKQEVSLYETSNIYTHDKQECVKENSQKRCISDINNNKSEGLSKTSMGSYTKLTFKTETSKDSSRSLKLSLESGTSTNKIKVSPSCFSLQSIRSITQVQDVDQAVNRERILETIQEGSIMKSEESTYMPTSYLHTGQENGIQSNESSQSSLILKWYLSSGKKLRSFLNLQAQKESTATYQYEDDKSTSHVKYKEAINVNSMRLPQGSETRKEISKFHRTLSPKMEEKGFQECASNKSTEKQKNSQQRISWETTLLNKWNSWISQRSSQSSPHSKTEVKNLQSNSSKDITEKGLSLIQETSKCAPKMKLHDNMKTGTKNEFMTAQLETRTISDNITGSNLTITLEQTPQENDERQINTEIDFPNTSKGSTTVQKLSSIKNWLQQRAQISTSIKNQVTNKKLEKWNELDDKRTPLQNSHVADKWTDKFQSLRENKINKNNSLQEISSYENVLLENKRNSTKEKHNQLLENKFAPYSPRGLYTVTSKLQSCSPREHNYEMNLAMKKENSKSIQLAAESATKLRNMLSITSQDISAPGTEQKRNMNENIGNKLGKDDRNSNLFTASKPNFITRWFQHDVTVNRGEVPGTSNTKKNLIMEESKLSWLGSYVLKKCNEKCQGFMEKYVRLGETKHPNKRVIEETCKHGGPTEINLKSKISSKLIMRKSASSDETINHKQPNFKISLSNQEHKHKSSSGSHDPEEESNLNLKQKLGWRNKKQMKKSLSTTRYSRERYSSERNKSRDENLRSVSSCSDVCSISGKKPSLVNFIRYKKGRSKISQRAKIKKLQIPSQISLSNPDKNQERRNTSLSRSGSNRTLLVWCSPNTESLCTVPSFSSTELCERFIQSIEQGNIAPKQFSNSNIVLEEKGSHITNRKLGKDKDYMKKILSKENSSPHFIRYRKRHRQKKIQSGYICLNMRDLSRNRTTPEKNEITLNPSTPPRRYSSSDGGSQMDCLDPEECECQCDQRKEKFKKRKSTTFSLREEASDTENQNKKQSNENSFIGKEKVPKTTTSQSKICPLKKKRNENHNYPNKSPKREETTDDDRPSKHDSSHEPSRRRKEKRESRNESQQRRKRSSCRKTSKEKGTQTMKNRKVSHKRTQYPEEPSRKDKKCPFKRKSTSKQENSGKEPGSRNPSKQRRKRSCCRKKSSRNTEDYSSSDDGLCHVQHSKSCPATKQTTCCICSPENNQSIQRKVTDDTASQTEKEERQQSRTMTQFSEKSLSEGGDKSGMAASTKKKCPFKRDSTRASSHTSTEKESKNKRSSSAGQQRKKKKCSSRRNSKEKRTQTVKEQPIKSSQRDMKQGRAKTKKCPFKKASKASSSSKDSSYRNSDKTSLCEFPQEKKLPTDRKVTKDKYPQTDQSSKNKPSYSFTDISSGNIRNSRSCPIVKPSGCLCSQEIKQSTNRKATDERASQTEKQTTSTKMTQYSERSLNKGDDKLDLAPPQRKKCPFKSSTDIRASVNSLHQPSSDKCSDKKSLPHIEQKQLKCICTHKTRRNDEMYQTTKTKKRKCPFKKNTAKDERRGSESDSNLQQNSRASKRSKLLVKQCTSYSDSCPNLNAMEAGSVGSKSRKQSKTKELAKKNSSLSDKRCYKGSCPGGKSTESSNDSLKTRNSYQTNRSKKAKQRRSTFGDQNLLCLRCAESCPGFQKQKSARICPLKRSSSTSKEETILLEHECLCAKKYNESLCLEKRKSKGSCPFKKSRPTSKGEVTDNPHTSLCEERINQSARLEKKKSRSFCPFKKSSSTSNEEISPNQCKCPHCVKMRKKTAGLEKDKSPSKTTSTLKKETVVHQHECSCAKEHNESAVFEKRKSRGSCPFKKHTSTSKDKHECMHCAKMGNKTAGLERKKTKGFCPKKSSSTQKECLCAKEYNESVALKKRKSWGSCPFKKSSPIKSCSNESVALERKESRGFCPFKKSSSTSNEEITANQCKCSHCVKMRNKTAVLGKEKSKSYSPSKTTSTPKKETVVHEHECSFAKEHNESAVFEKRKSRDSCPFKKHTSTLKDKHECMHCAKMGNKTAGLERKKTKGFCPKKSSSTQKECLCAKEYNESLALKKRKSLGTCPFKKSSPIKSCSNESVALEKKESRGFCPFKKRSSTSNEEITANQCKCSHCVKMRNKTAVLRKEKSKSFSPSKITSTPKKERTVHQHECMHCAKMRNKTVGLERKKSKGFCPKKSSSREKEETTADQHECLCAEKMNKASGPEKKKNMSLCPSSRSNPTDYCFNVNKEAERKRTSCLTKENEPTKCKDCATVISSHANTCYSSRNSSQKRGSKPQKKCHPKKKKKACSCLKKCCRCCKSCCSDDSEFCFCEDGTMIVSSNTKNSRHKKNKKCSCFKSCWICCKSCCWDDTEFCDVGHTCEEQKKKKRGVDNPYCTRIYRARKHVAKRARKKKCSKIIQTDNTCECVPQEKKSFEVICFSEKPVCKHSNKSMCTSAGSDVSTKSANAKKSVCINIPWDGDKNTKSCTFKEKRSTRCLGMHQQKPKVQKTECPYAQYCSSPNISVVVESKPLSSRQLTICKSRSESTVGSRPCSKFSYRYKSTEGLGNIKQCLQQWKNTNRLKNVQRRKRTEEAIERLKNIDFKETLERWRQARRLRRGNRNHAQVMLTNTAASVLGGIGGLFKNSWSFFDDAQSNDADCERRWKTYKKLAAMDRALEEEEAKRNERDTERIKHEKRELLRRRADEQYDQGYGAQVDGGRKCYKCKKGAKKIKPKKQKEKKKKTEKKKVKKVKKVKKEKKKKTEKKKVKKEKKKKQTPHRIRKLNTPTKHSFSYSQKQKLSAFERKQDSRLRKLHSHIDKHIDKLKQQQAKREKKNAAKEKEADTFHQLMHSMKTRKVIKEGKQNTDLHKKEIDYLKKKIKSEKEKYKKMNMDVQKDMDKAIEHQLRKLRESNEIRRKKALQQIQEIEKQNQMYNEIEKKNISTEKQKGECNKEAAQRKVAARKEYLRKVKEKERLLFEKFKKEQEEANEAFRKKKLEHENKAKLKIKLQQDKENRELSKLREQLRKKELETSNKLRRKHDESIQGRQQMILQLIMKQKQTCMKKKTKLEEKYTKRNIKINNTLNKMNILSQKYDDKIQKKKKQYSELKEQQKRAKIILAQKQQQKQAQRRKRELQRLRTAMEKLDKAIEKNKKMQQDKLSKINEKYKQTSPKKEVNLKRQDSLKKLEAKLASKAVKRRLMMKEREQMEKLKIKHYEMQKAKQNSGS